MDFHNVKILPVYFTPMMQGKKKFEIRKNDRDFKVGDALMLMECQDGNFTGRQQLRVITYILKEVSLYGLKTGYCILSLGNCPI